MICLNSSWLSNNDPGARTIAVRVMIAGWGVGKVGVRNVTHSKSYPALSITDPTFGDSTLAVTARGTGGPTRGPITPCP